jgi:hypothetical protein
LLNFGLSSLSENVLNWGLSDLTVPKFLDLLLRLRIPIDILRGLVGLSIEMFARDLGRIHKPGLLAFLMFLRRGEGENYSNNVLGIILGLLYI